MMKCSKCGIQVEDGIKFCPSCGAPTEFVEAASQEQKGEEFFSKISSINETADTTADFDKEDIEQNKIMGVFAYLSWLVLIPIFAAPKSKFARFHANQGLCLAMVELAWWIVQLVVTRILLFILPWTLFGIYSLFSVVLSLVNIVFLLLAILGIVNAVNGKAKELPVIGKFKLLK